MKRTTLATAIVLVVAGIAAGLSTVPVSTAASSVCDQKDYAIPDSEPLDIDARGLNAGMSEVGVEDVAAGSPEKLSVELVEAGNNGQLNWTVYFEDDQGECQTFTSGNCDLDGSFPNIIRTEGDAGKQECDLDDPSSGTRDYHVLFEAGDQNAIEYKAWESS